MPETPEGERSDSEKAPPAGREMLPGHVGDALPEVYTTLHGIAVAYLHSQRPGHTLQPTALVNEAYLKLARQVGARWNDRAHFVAIAATAMRQILVNHAMARKAAKRG